MTKDLASQSIETLAKYGRFDELSARVNSGEPIDLAKVFDRAVTDFRTVRRNCGHMDILRFCIDQGISVETRTGWMNQSIICLAAMYGNNEIIEYMTQSGLTANPFARTALGDICVLQIPAGNM